MFRARSVRGGYCMFTQPILSHTRRSLWTTSLAALWSEALVCAPSKLDTRNNAVYNETHLWP